MTTIDAAVVLRRAATHLDAASRLAASANDQKLPVFFFRGRAVAELNATYGRAVAQGREAIALLDGASGPAHDVIQGVDVLLAKIDPTVPREQNKGLDWLRTFFPTRDVASHLQVYADRLRLVAEHIGTEPAVVRSTLDADVAAIVSKPFTKITRTDIRRLAAIDGMPEEFRPNLPPQLHVNHSLTELVAQGILPGTDNIARGEFEMHRLQRARVALVADPSVTAEALDAEARAIISTPNGAVTTEQVERLSVIAGLGDDLRPTILDTRLPWADHRLQDLSAWGLNPRQSGEARAKFAALRMAVEHEAMLADPSLTKQSVTDELVRLLAIPNDELTHEQLYRTSQLSRLPEHLRPSMPRMFHPHYRFDDLGLLGYHPRTHLAATEAFDEMRIHMHVLADPEAKVRELATRIHSNERVDLRVLAALEGQDDLLRANGLTPEVLDRAAVHALSGAGSTSKAALEHHLRLVRDLIKQTPTDDPTVAEIRSKGLELADRNIKRMSGARRDTFARHPNYAEVGQIVSIAELLDAVRTRTSPVATTTSSAEVLPW